MYSINTDDRILRHGTEHPCQWIPTFPRKCCLLIKDRRDPENEGQDRFLSNNLSTHFSFVVPCIIK